MPARVISVKEGGRIRKFIYVRLSDGQKLRLLPEVAVAESITVGRELTSGEIARLGIEESQAEVYSCALRMLSRRAHSRGELRDKLTLRGYSSEMIESVTRKLRDKGYLDDEGFARSFARHRLESKPCGKRFLAQELYKKRVSRAIISKALDEIFAGVDQSEAALRLLNKRASRYAKYEGKDLTSRLYRFLQGRGFSYDDIMSAISRFHKGKS